MSNPTPRRRRLMVEDNGEITIVNFIDRRLAGDQNIDKIGEDLFSLVDELSRHQILLKFSNVELMEASMLGKLITLNKKVLAAGGKLVMCNIADDIYEVFEITRLNKLFHIVENEQDGLQAFEP